MALLEVENLTVLKSQSSRWGQLKKEAVRLVDGVSFVVPPGQSLAIVGENNSGTLPLTFALLGMAGVAEGRIIFQDREITLLREGQMRRIRRQMPALFSDDFESLPPHQTIGHTLRSAHRNGGGSWTKAGRIREIERAMDHAGLALALRDEIPASIAPADRQRAALARALLQHPLLLILHHFTRGLDPAAEAALLNRISDLQEELGLAFLVITHDLAIAHHLAPMIHVMSRGAFVDSGPGKNVIAEPRHEYTQRLIASATSGVPKV